MENNEENIKKESKYNIILGVMIFIFVIFVAVILAFSLGIIGNNSETKEDTNNNKQESNINVYDEKENNTKEEIDNTVVVPSESISIETEENIEETQTDKTENNSSKREEATSSNSTVVENEKVTVSDVIDIVESGNELVDEALGELGMIAESLQNQILQSYNNKIVSGIQAKSAVQQYINSTDLTVILIKDDKMIATVGAKKLAEGSITKSSGYYEITPAKYVAEGGDLHKTSMDDFNNFESQMYINSAKNYQAYLLAITGMSDPIGIVFVQK